MIKGKTPEEIRKLFNIVNDFTPEEEVRPLLFEIIPQLLLTPFSFAFFRPRSRRRTYVFLTAFCCHPR